PCWLQQQEAPQPLVLSLEALTYGWSAQRNDVQLIVAVQVLPHLSKHLCRSLAGIDGVRGLGQLRPRPAAFDVPNDRRPLDLLVQIVSDEKYTHGRTFRVYTSEG